MENAKISINLQSQEKILPTKPACLANVPGAKITKITNFEFQKLCKLGISLRLPKTS